MKNINIVGMTMASKFTSLRFLYGNTHIGNVKGSTDSSEKHSPGCISKFSIKARDFDCEGISKFTTED